MAKVKKLECIGRCPCGNVRGKVNGGKAAWYTGRKWKKLEDESRGKPEESEKAIDDEDESTADDEDEDKTKSSDGWD